MPEIFVVRMLPLRGRPEARAHAVGVLQPLAGLVLRPEPPLPEPEGTFEWLEWVELEAMRRCPWPKVGIPQLPWPTREDA